MSKKYDIMESALKVFVEKGYQEATISQIAKKAGISDASIYQYFKNKEDLLFKIPEKKMEEVINLSTLHLQGIKGTLNKIRKFIWFYLWFFQTNREWATIVMLDLKTSKRFLRTSGYLLVKKFTSKLITLLEEGKEEGCIRKDVDPYIFRSMIIGTIENLTIRWLLLNKPKNLVDYADGVADLVVASVKP